MSAEIQNLGQETICALCTAPGGAIAIIRISGPEALAAGQRIWYGKQQLSPENARKMLLGKIRSGEQNGGEQCLAVYMPGPHSYTGEDTVELHCHGGTMAPLRLLKQVLACGIRSAEPGEFTRRAFINGKMDLTQAEAVADLIGAKSDSAARLAEKQMNGLLGNKIRQAREQLLSLTAELESRMDFPEEELDWMSPQEVAAIYDLLEHDLSALAATASGGKLLREGLRTVIAGRPNAGKSSLLNALLGYERAIVTEIPGTTRDTLEEFAVLRGIPVLLTDTAGLRQDAADRVEHLGIERTRSSLQSAEFLFWVLDPAEPEESIAYMKENLPHGTPGLAVWNKCDLLPEGSVLPEAPLPAVRISAINGSGLNELTERFSSMVWKGPVSGANECEVSARHGELLRQTLALLSRAKEETLRENWELASFNCREALASLGKITGEEASPDLLDEIFSRFCIGK